jgi:hypothetical protein
MPFPAGHKTRLDFGHLEIEITLDDPKAYTKPWTIRLDQTIKLDTDLIDSVCHENEKGVQHLVVKQALVVTNAAGRLRGDFHSALDLRPHSSRF